MHRTQAEKFQIHPDFDKHFRKVWTGDLRGCLCKNHPLNFASKIILPETLVTERLHQG